MVTPYSEIYESHPHRLLVTSTGWKRNPDRADFFAENKNGRNAGTAKGDINEAQVEQSAFNPASTD